VVTGGATAIHLFGPPGLTLALGEAAPANAVRLEIDQIVGRCVGVLEEATIPAVLRHVAPRLVDKSQESRYMRSRETPRNLLFPFANETIFRKRRAGNTE
jgi:hypothetical protein